mgnify:CR=1 FL=1
MREKSLKKKKEEEEEEKKEIEGLPVKNPPSSSVGGAGSRGKGEPTARDDLRIRHVLAPVLHGSRTFPFKEEEEEEEEEVGEK